MSTSFKQSIAAFDAINAEDPRQLDGRPHELVYAERLTAWVHQLAPEASEALLLAARAQHIARWTIDRSSYPEGLNGYLQWREDLKQFHADKARTIMVEQGYDQETVALVQAFIRKDNFPEHPESRTLEDALCLLFIETQLDDFARTKTEEKTIDILQKTWGKMSEEAHTIAQELPLPDHAKQLLQRALKM